MLPISNGDPEIDSGKANTIVKHNDLTKVVAKRRKDMGFYVPLGLLLSHNVPIIYPIGRRPLATIINQTLKRQIHF